MPGGAQHLNTRPVEGLACLSGGGTRREQPIESAKSMRETGRSVFAPLCPATTEIRPLVRAGEPFALLQRRPGEERHGACLDCLESPASCHLAGRCPSARRPIEPDARAQGASATNRNFSDVGTAWIPPIDGLLVFARRAGTAASGSFLFGLLLAWIESEADGCSSVNLRDSCRMCATLENMESQGSALGAIRLARQAALADPHTNFVEEPRRVIANAASGDVSVVGRGIFGIRFFDRIPCGQGKGS